MCFSNIKHCFFQPCTPEEIIVIVHFHLKQPILIGTKKVQDVQFFKESCVAAEDINFKGGRHKMNDIDELEQEERERQQKKRLNTRFLNFSKLIEQAADNNKTPVEVDIPQDDLSFSGCASKSVVKIRPTKNCLVAISEFPFFVMEFDEIQAVHFERIIFGIKNFDLALINKDFNNFRRINSIPMEHIDDLKSFFDEIGVIFCEGPATLNWPAVLGEIRNNFEDWLEDGGWNFLAEESEQEEGEGAESEIDGDPSAAYGSEDEEDSESNFGSDDDSESLSDEEDSDSENLTEQGLSWDELDKMAEEEDRKASTRRAAAPVKKPTQQKRPAGKGKSGRY